MPESNFVLREKFAALLNRLACHLTTYQKQKSYSIEPNPTDNHSKLLSARCANITVLKTFITTLLTDLTKQEINDNFVQETLTKIEEKIHEALEKNSSLSLTYNKTHRSYRENRLEGLSMFSSWLHKTWLQSRATVQLEHCLDTLSNFRTSLAKKNSTVTRAV